MSASARFQMPFILPGQAQKEMFHNEALAIADAVLHPAVEGAAIAVPPVSPSEGQAWLVAEGAGGAWAGTDDSLAVWSGGGWRFVAPVPGMQVWDRAAGYWRYWTGSAWSSGDLPAARIVVDGAQVVGARQPEVPSPSGGTIIDAEARSAVAAVIVALKSHGLIE